jgi:hypothetical protein
LCPCHRQDSEAMPQRGGIEPRPPDCVVAPISHDQSTCHRDQSPPHTSSAMRSGPWRPLVAPGSPLRTATRRPYLCPQHRPPRWDRIIHVCSASRGSLMRGVHMLGLYYAPGACSMAAQPRTRTNRRGPATGELVCGSNGQLRKPSRSRPINQSAKVEGLALVAM